MTIDNLGMATIEELREMTPQKIKLLRAQIKLSREILVLQEAILSNIEEEKKKLEEGPC